MSNKDNYMQYRSGWIDGAKAAAMNPDRAEHPDKEFASFYVDGYNEGYKARCEMSMKASTRFGYMPSPIRLI